MHPAKAPDSVTANKQWPDFYSILGSSPDADSESLRRSINALYVKANEQSDHRELSTRFYNQVLSQKVLPQCRRILLNDHSRQAYNHQWHLHRDGDEAALSYPDFIREITKGAGSAGGLLLSDEEISILPSVRGVSHDPLAALKLPVPPAEESSTDSATTENVITDNVLTDNVLTGSEVIIGEEVLEPEPQLLPREEPRATSIAGRPVIAQAQTLLVAVPTPLRAPRKKAFPVAPLLAGLALLLGVGGYAWNASQKPAGTPGAPTRGAVQLYTLARNSDFEVPNMASWKVVGRIVSNRPETDPAKFALAAASGKASMTFFNSEPYNIDVRQTISGLKAGQYTLRARTKQGKAPKTAEMFAEGHGGSKRTAPLPQGWEWQIITIKNIAVTSGQCTIGFTFKSSDPKGGVGNVDAVEFFHQ